MSLEIDDALGPAVEFIARFGLVERLLQEHVPDEDERCRACTTPGYGTPEAPWPCLISQLATAAAQQP